MYKTTVYFVMFLFCPHKKLLGILKKKSIKTVSNFALVSIDYSSLR